jgi:tetratricopeptide (TPR) repeat protein
MGNQDKAREYLIRAFQLCEHASERERLTIAGTYYSDITGELQKAEGALRQIIESYPRLQEFESMEASPHVILGNVYMDQGRYEDAEKVTRQSLRFVPRHPYPYLTLSTALLALQHFNEARQIIHEGQFRTMDGVAFHADLYALAFLGMDSQATAEEQQWFAGRVHYESLGFALASDTEAFAGHLRKARELTKRSVDTAIHADSKENAAFWQENAAVRESAFGNVIKAKLAGAAGLRLAPTSQRVEVEAALASAMAGDIAHSQSLTQDLNKRFPLNTQMLSLWLPTIQAQSALDQKNPALALNILKAASSIELGRDGFVNISCLYPIYVRGEAYLAAEQGNAAAAEFQKILDHGGIVWNCWTGALAHLGVARANALEARTSQGADADAARVRALAAYKDFLKLWKDADPDIPIYQQAIAEYAKLQ